MSRVEQAIKDASTRGMRGPSGKGEFQVCCPFCNAATGKPDTKYKMYLSPAKGAYYCFKCSSGGHVDLAWLGQQSKAFKPREMFEMPELDLGPPKGFMTLREGSALIGPFRDYLRTRGQLQAAIAAEAGVCIDGRFGGRLIFPYLRGWAEAATGLPRDWLGFAARTIYPGVEPKYLFPTGMDKGKKLWCAGGLAAKLHEDPSLPVWVVEGTLDQLALGGHAVATLGKNVTEEQLDLLMQFRRPLVICLDGDAWEEGEVLAMRLVLRGHEQVFWCKLPPGEDPGSLGWNVKNYIVRP